MTALNRYELRGQFRSGLLHDFFSIFGIAGIGVGEMSDEVQGEFAARDDLRLISWTPSIPNNTFRLVYESPHGAELAEKDARSALDAALPDVLDEASFALSTFTDEVVVKTAADTADVASSAVDKASALEGTAKWVAVGVAGWLGLKLVGLLK